MKIALAILAVSLSAVDAFACVGRRCVPVRPGGISSGGAYPGLFPPSIGALPVLPHCPSRLSRLLTPKAVALAAYQDANEKFLKTKAFLKLIEARFVAGLATANEVAEADYARHEAETAAHAVRERALKAGGLVKDLAGDYMCSTLPGIDFSDQAATETGDRR